MQINQSIISYQNRYNHTIQ